jgi:ABC-type transporter Mla subunit MlaD
MHAVLTITDDHLRLEHEAVTYEPIASDAALGALLFALPPAEVRFTGATAAARPALQLSLATARQFAALLARHAARPDRALPRLPAGVSIAQAREWARAAGDAVPPAEHERFCARVAQALGDDPWGDGSPAVVLRHQQFGLFGQGAAAP